jgi:hypothetical protein
MLCSHLLHVDLVQCLPHALERSVRVPRDTLGVEYKDVAIVLIVVEPEVPAKGKGTGRC